MDEATALRLVWWVKGVGVERCYHEYWPRIDGYVVRVERIVCRTPEQAEAAVIRVRRERLALPPYATPPGRDASAGTGPP